MCPSRSQTLCDVLEQGKTSIVASFIFPITRKLFQECHFYRPVSAIIKMANATVCCPLSLNMATDCQYCKIWLKVRLLKRHLVSNTHRKIPLQDTVLMHRTAWQCNSSDDMMYFSAHLPPPRIFHNQFVHTPVLITRTIRHRKLVCSSYQVHTLTSKTGDMYRWPMQAPNRRFAHTCYFSNIILIVV